jgi:hypothetical protein
MADLHAILDMLHGAGMVEGVVGLLETTFQQGFPQG